MGPLRTSITHLYPKGDGFDRWLGEADSYAAAMQKRDEAAEAGERIHTACQSLLEQGRVAFGPEWADKEIDKVVGFTRFVKDYELAWDALEYPFVCDEYGGRIDIVGCITVPKEGRNGITIIDIKTGADLYYEYRIQVVAYAAAYEWLTGKNVAAAGLLHLKSTTKKGYQYVQIDRPSYGWYACDEWRILQALKVIHGSVNGIEPKVRSKERVAEVSIER